MPERQLGVRVSEEVAEGVAAIVESINNTFPAKNASTSDVLRCAIEEYVKQDNERKDNLIIKIPKRDLTIKEATVLLEAMKHIQTVVNTAEVDNAVLKYQELLEWSEFQEWKKENKK